MKINMPVTQNQVELKDNSQIVSKTDLKGRITFVNREFIDVSGFSAVSYTHLDVYKRQVQWPP